VTGGQISGHRIRLLRYAYEVDMRRVVKLEYLAVYGRASMAAFRQLSTHGQKFDPESLYEPM